MQASQEKPEGFKDYQRNSGSVGIISMLHQIIGDAKIMETKARVQDLSRAGFFSQPVRRKSTRLRRRPGRLECLAGRL